jgi:DNA-binding Lrp family transcriptional regulator
MGGEDSTGVRQRFMGELKKIFEERRAMQDSAVELTREPSPPPAPSRTSPPPSLLLPPPVTAFLLVRTVPAAVSALRILLQARAGVIEARPVSGEWNLVARVEARGLDQLADLVISIRREPAVQETCTLIALKGKQGRDAENAYPPIPPPPPPSGTMKRLPI